MVDLSQIDKNQKAFIKTIHAQHSLKKRLQSLGLSAVPDRKFESLRRVYKKTRSKSHWVLVRSLYV